MTTTTHQPRFLDLVPQPPVAPGAADDVARPEAGEHELGARSADGHALGRVDLEGLLPDLRDALHDLLVVRAGEHVPHFDLDALREDVADLAQAVTRDVLLEDDLDRLGHD